VHEEWIQRRGQGQSEHNDEQGIKVDVGTTLAAAPSGK
jgi:hypothetical protein